MYQYANVYVGCTRTLAHLARVLARFLAPPQFKVTRNVGNCDQLQGAPSLQTLN